MKKCIPACFILLIFHFPLFLSAQLPAGYTGEYPLDNSAIDISGNNNNGTLVSTTAIANRFGTSNLATHFISGTSYGSIPRIVQDNFSIAFWFNTTMTGNTSTMWYGGNSLVNAEVCGVTNDWGTALINGGKVCMGIGNPDITIFSPSSNYNDGNWHFVTAVRDETDGIIILYLDGSQVATTSGTNTGSLTAPGAIGLARDATFFTGICGAGTAPDYTGSLDDILVYNRVLSSAEVTSLYNFSSSIPLPLDWISFTGFQSGTGIDLNWVVEEVVNNNYFEVEHSTDAQHFSGIARIPNIAGLMVGAGSDTYAYRDEHPAIGANYYRIRQVDNNGNFTWSKIVAITSNLTMQGIGIFPNPSSGNPLLFNPGLQFIGELRMIDVRGNILQEQYVNSNNSTITLECQNLAPGNYWIQVTGSNGILAIIPFVRI